MFDKGFNESTRHTLEGDLPFAAQDMSLTTVYRLPLCPKMQQKQPFDPGCTCRLSFPGVHSTQRKAIHLDYIIMNCLA